MGVLRRALAPRAEAAPPRAADLPYRLVIFDFDGTLSDSGGWFLSIADELAERFNFRRVGEDEVEQLRGKTTKEVIRHVGIPRWKLPRIGRYVHQRFREDADRIHLFPGVDALLAQLSARGVRIAVCTSNSEDNARLILGPENVARIAAFECGASLFGKAPKFKRILRKLGVDPGDTISIGDETRDLLAARKVGIAAGVVLWGYANREILAKLHPDVMFEAPEAIADLLAPAPGDD